jgi:hypothetical protein
MLDIPLRVGLHAEQASILSVPSVVWRETQFAALVKPAFEHRVVVLEVVRAKAPVRRGRNYQVDAPLRQERQSVEGIP